MDNWVLKVDVSYNTKYFRKTIRMSYRVVQDPLQDPLKGGFWREVSKLDRHLTWFSTTCWLYPYSIQPTFPATQPQWRNLICSQTCPTENRINRNPCKKKIISTNEPVSWNRSINQGHKSYLFLSSSTNSLCQTVQGPRGPFTELILWGLIKD